VRATTRVLQRANQLRSLSQSGEEVAACTICTSHIFNMFAAATGARCPAGVTTGPVTVPFVLAIGIGFSKAVGASEGFGMVSLLQPSSY
jgi:hypothetical protein